MRMRATVPSDAERDDTGSGGHADVVLVGGGLANSLIALRLRALRPDLRVLLLEREAVPDRRHTWSYFSTDVGADTAAWLDPFAEHRWDSYDVRFPDHVRTLSTSYRSLSGGGLAHLVDAAVGNGVRRGVEVAQLTPTSVQSADGRRWSAPLVVDGTGARPSRHLALAWQKFVGLELSLAAPHGLHRPILMDATGVQEDGFRFLYLLPFDTRRVLVEDTRYSDDPALDVEALSRQVTEDVVRRGWRISRIERQETGVLPIALGGDIGRFWREAEPGVPQVGLRAALFHPVTGYSLPEAARTAELIACSPVLTSQAVASSVEAVSKRLWRRRGYLRMLNRMMFLAAAPEQRYRVLQRFYRLPQPLIERFYAGEPTMNDRLRLLAGKPPVPPHRALAALPQWAANGRRNRG